MSVILTGMDMPKNCFECGLKLRGMCPRLIKNITVTDRTIDERCPLRPVDGLIEEIKKETVCPYGKCIGKDCSNMNDCMIMGEHAVKIIEDYCEVKG